MIHSAEIRNFRCFKELSIDNCRRFNVIVGENGAGKTALLEALFFALVSSPTVALRYRAQRGLESALGGSNYIIEEAMWRDLFYRGLWDQPLSVMTKGDGQENRSVIVSRGAQAEIPFSAAEQPEARAAGVQFRWINSAGRERVFVPKVSPTGLTLGETDEEQLPEYFFFAANQTITSVENAGRFSEIRRSGRMQEFLLSLKQAYPWIENLDIEIVAQLPVIYATLNTGEQFPLANISGGVNRIISIMLAIGSRARSVVLVDEIEDGIYYKHQPDIWRAVTAIARKQDGQLFLTTHNEEWLGAVFENQDVSDVALWRLERGDKGPVLRQFSGAQASVAVKSSGEVR